MYFTIMTIFFVKKSFENVCVTQKQRIHKLKINEGEKRKLLSGIHARFGMTEHKVFFVKYNPGFSAIANPERVLKRGSYFLSLE